MEEKETYLNGTAPESRTSIHARLEHFTWAWFTITMATGGMALLLGSQPHAFHGLRTIGKIVYIFDITMFLTIVSLITYRFTHYPGTFIASLTHPSESIFFATSWLSLNSVISCMGKYGVPSTGEWLVTTYRVLFWIYFCLTFLSAVFQYYLLFTSESLKIQDATPAWDLPIFPFMLCGTLATVGVPFQTTTAEKMTMLVAGLTAQGLGMLMSIIMFTLYIRRMVQFGLPSPASRPAMFISVGPPSFTTLAIIGLARGYPESGTYFGDIAITRQVVLILATFTSVFIWSLAFWFFCVALVANLAVWREIKFKLNWWAYVFPNVGFTIATIDIGEVFQSQGVTWIGSVMTCILGVTYGFIFYKHVQAVWRGQILMSGKDEDVFEHEKMSKLDKSDKKAPRSGEAMKRAPEHPDVRQRLNGISSQSSEPYNIEHTEESAA